MNDEEKGWITSIGDIYHKFSDEETKEIDALGYADRLKQCAELFFHTISNEYGYHAEDIEYLSEYFMVGTGTNSIVHFHIKECPGWLFGIWWTVPTEKDDAETEFDGEFFTQYEESIDKFKPYASIYSAELFINLKDKNGYLFNVKRIMDFIHKEPALAFCRDRYALDYNYEYYTREKAQEIFDKCMRGEEVEWDE